VHYANPCCPLPPPAGVLQPSLFIQHLPSTHNGTHHCPRSWLCSILKACTARTCCAFRKSLSSPPSPSEGKESIYFHHHPHSSLPATKAEFWSNSLKHQLEGWALSTGDTQGEERVFFVSHKNVSCSLAASLAGGRGRLCSWGCTVCRSWPCPASRSRKHFVLVQQSVSILNCRGVCVCARACVCVHMPREGKVVEKT